MVSVNIRRGSLFVFVLLILNAVSLYSQNSIEPPTIQNIIPPSPTSASFEKIENAPVNLFNGNASVNVPIWTIESGSLGLPIDLNYSTIAIMPDELSGFVGVNWILNAGGVISRTVYGRPDDQGWLLDNDKIPDNIDDSISYYTLALNEIAKGCKDGSTDVYSISCSNLSTKFVFDKSNQPLPMPFRVLKINPIIEGFQIRGWVIVDEAGTSYKFFSKEFNKTNKSCSQFNFFGSDGLCPYNDLVSAWKIDTIISRDKKDTILFEYDNYDQKYVSLGIETVPVNIDNSCDTMESVMTHNRCNNYHWHQLKVLKKVKSKNEIVYFNYKENIPESSGCPLLDSVEILSYSLKKVKTFYFYYENNSNRAFLSSIKEKVISNNETKKYEFSYYNSGISTSNKYAIDEFGYFNGQLNNTSLISFDDSLIILYTDIYPSWKPDVANRNIYPEYVTHGALKKVTYPTKGSKVFYYEPHSIIYDSKTKIETNSQIINFDCFEVGGIDEKNIEFSEHIYKCDISIIELSSINDPGPGHNSNTQLPYLTLKDSFGNLKGVWQCCNIIGSLNNPYNTVLKNLEPGMYKFSFYGFDLDDRASIKVTTYDSINLLHHEDFFGGIRVKKIEYYDENDFLEMSRSYCYNKFNDSITSGIIPIPIRYTTTTLSIYTIRIDSCKVEICTVPLVERDKSLPLQPVKSGFIGYTDVTEQVETGDKTFSIQHKYSWADDLENISFGIVKAPHSSKDTKRGNELWSKSIDKNGALQDETFNEYTDWQEFSDESSNNPNCSFTQGLVVKQGGTYLIVQGDSSTVMELPPFYNEYFNFSEWQYKKQDSIVEYFPEGKVISVRNYYYDNPEHAQLTRILEKNSKQKSLKSMFYYAHDIDGDNNDGITMSSATLNKIKNSNFLAPVKKEVYEENRLIEGVVNNYNEALLLSSVNALFETAYDTAYFIKEHDMYGNILQIQKKNDVIQSYVWGYNYSYPIAHITNSTKESVAHTSFEDTKTFSGRSFSNDDWESGYCSIKNNSSYGGRQCFVFQGSNLKTKKSFPPGKYRIRMWTKLESGSSGLITLSGQSGIFWNAGNTWQLKENIITLTNNSTIILVPSGGSILVDDISIIPYDAQIETYTWLPSVGMSSATDAKGNVVNYIYDGFGRLIMTKDQDGNIIESYEYHFAE